MCPVPGVAGRAGAEDGVGDGDKDEVAMEPTVHPALGHHVGAVSDGATCAGNKRTHVNPEKEKKKENRKTALEIRIYI